MLFCPFCHAKEESRIEAIDEGGEKILLVMFNCPFFYRFDFSKYTSDEEMQEFLQDWRKENGDKWLDEIGPIMQRRELRNIERSVKTRTS